MLKKVYISADADKSLIKYIEAKGYETEKVQPHAAVGPAISKHPDVYMCRLQKEIYFGDPQRLQPDYPGDVLYNAAQVGKYFLCSKHTARELTDKAMEAGLELIKLKQGYVKCNLVVIDDRHVITEDSGIAMALNKTDIDCLLISPKHVSLPGYPYGFIGGASGRIDNEIIFCGNLAKHPDYKKIADFIKACNLNIRYFDNFPLTDLGSIIC